MRSLLAFNDSYCLQHVRAGRVWVVAITSLRLLEGIRTDRDLLRVKFICRRIFFVLAGTSVLLGGWLVVLVTLLLPRRVPPQQRSDVQSPSCGREAHDINQTKAAWTPSLSLSFYQFRSVCQFYCLSDFVCLSLCICLFPSLALSVRLSVILAVSQSLASLRVSPLSLPLEVLTY